MAMINLSFFFITCSFFILFLDVNSTLAALPTTQNGDHCMICYRIPEPGAQGACLALCSHLYDELTSSNPSLPITKDDWNQNINGQACMMCGRLPPGAQDACLIFCSHLYELTSLNPSLLPTKDDWKPNINGQACMMCGRLPPGAQDACLIFCSHLYELTSLNPSLLPTKDDWNQNGQSCAACRDEPSFAQDACRFYCSHLNGRRMLIPSIPTKDDWNQNGRQECKNGCYKIPESMARTACLMACSFR